MIEKLELVDIIRDAIKAHMENVHTALVARVEAIAADKKTIDVRPVVNRVVDDDEVQYPVFAQVPPVFLSGGGSSLSFPIAVGDYALLVFSQRCFDNWYQGQDFQAPPEFRVHDPSDAFAIVGLHNKAGAITIPSETTILGNVRLGVAVPESIAARADKVQAELASLSSAFSAHTHEYLPGPGTLTATTAASSYTAPTEADIGAAEVKIGAPT